MKSRSRDPATPGSPFLTSLSYHHDRVNLAAFPFTLPIFGRLPELEFAAPVTFLVGENGSGKSTLLEAIAWRVGFGAEGGNCDHRFDEEDTGRTLGRALLLGWRQRVAGGFFLRAETFFNFATRLDDAGTDFRSYGGAPLNSRSHGEGFLAVFENRFEDGLYLLDEPEAALSPQRQLAFLRILHDLTRTGAAQFIVATHSPILLAFPGATLLSFDGQAIVPTRYEDTEHYQVTRDFLEVPERFLRQLFADDATDL